MLSYFKIPILYIFTSFFFVVFPKAQVLNTFAGSGTAGFSGDGGSALLARLYGPGAIAINQAENTIVFCDKYNHRIRKIDIQSGIITTIAGNGKAGFNGDGRLAILAEINEPQDICIDSKGNIIFFDDRNYRIRKIDNGSGIISTIAGNGSNVLVNNVPATETGMTSSGITLDKLDNIYLAEDDFALIRKIDGSTGIISVIAGNGSRNYTGDGGPSILAGVPGPHALNVDANGNILFTDTRFNTVRRIDAVSKIISTIAGDGTSGYNGDGGLPLNANFNFPADVIADMNGNIFIADAGNHVVRRIDAITGIINTVAGNGIAGFSGNGILSTCSQLNSPIDLVSDSSGNIYIVDFTNNSIRKLEFTPVVPTAATIQISQLTTSDCQGSGLNFVSKVRATAFPDFITYNWKINGKSFFAFEDNVWIRQFKEGDTVTCELSGINNICEKFNVVSNPVIIRLNDEPVPEIKIASDVKEICPGDAVRFTAIPQNTGPSTIYTWYRNGTTIGSNSSNFSSSALTDGDRIYCIMQANTLNCPQSQAYYSDTIIIKVNTPPVLELSPADTTIEPGGSVAIRSMVSTGIINIQWNTSTGLNNNNITNPIASPLITTNYTLRAFSASGCSSTDSVKINIYRPVVMPNAFTPNGDGKNDIFRIPPGHEIESGLFRVFNRWGEQVFQSRDLNMGWDGTFKSIQQQSGVFTYIIEGTQNNKKLQLKGTVMLIR